MCDSVEAGNIHEDETLYGLISSAFREAYPDVPDERLEHIARNFIQVISGVIDVGARNHPDSTEKPTHLDMVNSIVYWCVANTHLEDFIEKPGEPSTGERVIPAAEADLLMQEVCARVADWLAGLEALKARPELYDAFINGSLAMSGNHLKRTRDALEF
jgi:hypothetical protein